LAAPEGAGDTWTWTGLTDKKLIISYLIGGRDAGYARDFMDDLAERLDIRVQLTTDGAQTLQKESQGQFKFKVRHYRSVVHRNTKLGFIGNFLS